MTVAKKPSAKKHGGARANSGGKRASSGRKPSQLPEDKLKSIGEMPANPLKFAEWGRQLNGIVLEGLARGLPWKDLSKHIDRGLRTSMDLVELEIKSKAILSRLDDEDDDTTKMTPREESNAQPVAGAIGRDP